MPVITMYGPKMTRDQKAKLVEAFATKGGEILGLPPEVFNTTIIEMDLENVGNGTKLLADVLKDEK